MMDEEAMKIILAGMAALLGVGMIALRFWNGPMDRELKNQSNSN